ncbi:AAA family ATPase, partial [Bacteriovorax sp. DB6_IX]|uniref:AAA family ATPase n=1 Tax=Bacteriovorax sp. DB6_IX TaxID=1353530 RepID=UPI00038A49A5
MNSKLVLKTVKLQNFATFTNQTIDFTNNFNTIVGETGSGKSLILDALQMCFGARADKKLVRKDAEFSTIEVSFSCQREKAKDFFDEIGFPFEDDIVIKRVIYNNGKSKSFL